MRMSFSKMNLFTAIIIFGIMINTVTLFPTCKDGTYYEYGKGCVECSTICTYNVNIDGCNYYCPNWNWNNEDNSGDNDDNILCICP